MKKLIATLLIASMFAFVTVKSIASKGEGRTKASTPERAESPRPTYFNPPADPTE